MRDVVAVDQDPHAVEEAIRGVVAPRERDDREAGSAPLGRLLHPEKEAFGDVPGEGPRGVEILRGLDEGLPELMEDEAPPEDAHPELAQAPPGNRNVVEAEAVSVEPEHGLRVAVLARPGVVQEVVRVEEKKDELRMKAHTLLLEEEQLLVRAVAGHGLVDELERGVHLLESPVEHLLPLDAEAPRGRIAEEQHAAAPRRREGRNRAVAQALGADLDARRAVGKDEGTLPSFPQTPPETRIRAEERDAADRGRAPRGPQRAHGELGRAGSRDEDAQGDGETEATRGRARQPAARPIGAHGLEDSRARPGRWRRERLPVKIRVRLLGRRRTQVVKGRLCKSLIRRFESDRRLHLRPAPEDPAGRPATPPRPGCGPPCAGAGAGRGCGSSRARGRAGPRC